MLSVSKLLEVFENKYIFKTSSKEKGNTEAPKSAPLGEWAWPSCREGIPDEKDTSIERRIYQEIKKHFSSNRVGLSKFVVRSLKKILEKGWYKEILHPPPYKTLYRGMKINNIKDLSKLIKVKEEEIKDKGSVDFQDKINIKLTNGHSTSWTFQKKITKDFATDYGKAKQGFAVILLADVDDNPNSFLAGPNGLYDVEGLSRWHLEKETIGLEPIFIKRIEWYKL